MLAVASRKIDGTMFLERCPARQREKKVFETKLEKQLGRMWVVLKKSKQRRVGIVITCPTLLS